MGFFFFLESSPLVLGSVVMQPASVAQALAEVTGNIGARNLEAVFLQPVVNMYDSIYA